MYEDEIKFLNNNDITVLKEYFKQWGSKKLEYLIVEDKFGYRYNREKEKIFESVKDGSIYDYRFNSNENNYNKSVYISTETDGDVECIEFNGKSIKMYSKKFNETWTKTWQNIIKLGIYNARILEKNGVKTGYSKVKEKTLSEYKSMIGMKFGRLLITDVISEDCGKRGVRHKFVCKCDCGNTKITNKSDLTSGRVESCGCLHSELLSKRMSSVNPWEFHNSYKWYFYDKNNNIVPCRSSYEVIYANYLVENNIKFEYEPKCFTINSRRRYTPDFYLIDSDEWIEIKGRTDKNPYSNQEENRKIFSKTHKLKLYLWKDLMKICGLKYKSSTSYNKNAKKNNVSYEYYLANRMYQQ